ncbi:distal tail protein Dit [Peptostreptococcus canis]|uniref:Siphovirus-type tail component RIFT-related domain-containing protein n=1 Tax=Peptostreptococcus canis TaxID=1159213 RepID=A0ABR6TJB1_9FIRM|nr:distal tail protein Dit [Peptostreptococcus canis]MBC2575223.1 hypothetical protein [Peptostreptococcus canis]MBP1997600.1 putative phage tail component-like protein [Peptostreptococcus canis]
MNHHGVFIDNKHSYYDFGLIMQSVSIGFPKPNIEKISIPGRDGELDLSTVLTGEMTYKNREISISFIFPDKDEKSWFRKISEISNHVHGRKTRIIFDSDKDYYYEGMCEVNTIDTEFENLQITIHCNAFPYKLRDMMVTAQISGNETISLYNLKMRTIPKIYSSSTMDLEYKSKTYHLQPGENIFHDLRLDSGNNLISINGTGKVEISYRAGDF